MRIKRSFAIRDKLRYRITEAYRETVRFHSTLNEHLDRMQRYVQLTDEYKRLPVWTRQYLNGYADSLWDQLYSSQLNGSLSPLTTCLEGSDGHIFIRPDDSWLNESHEYKSNMRCHHIWRAALPDIKKF